ncbi:MAG: peroxide stress protein YaaA [Moraxellaceae bacterium]|nr:MAG: peroxide stress protein YaaA [Moraxellaceae bacterium]
MLAVISPAKTLDFETKPQTKKFTQGEFLEDSQDLINVMRDYSPQQIAKLMSISDPLSTLNYGRFQDWATPFSLDNAKQALLAFKGDVYTGLEAESLSSKQLQFAQKHLRILSGLYGLLRPLDLIQPYRLEMGIKLENQRGKNLYQFWGDKITDELNQQLKKQKSTTLINLASNEYFKSIQKKKLDADIIVPAFKDYKNGDYKMISFFAKKARGAMCRYIIDENITEADNIKGFSWHGYGFNPTLSKGNTWVFTRKEV